MSKRVSFFCGAPPPKKERKEEKGRKEKGPNDMGDEGNILRSLAKSTLYFLKYMYTYIGDNNNKKKGSFFLSIFLFYFY